MKANYKILIKRIIYVCIFLFVILNIVCVFHAYNFTHFNSNAQKRTNLMALSSIGKMKVLLFGIENPKPQNTIKPNYNYKNINILYDKDIINCWFLDNKDDKGTIMLFHGYTGCKSQVVEKGNFFYSQNYDVVLVDFIGSGDSSGNITTVGYHEANQLNAVYHYFKNKTSKIYLFGISMGAVAIMKAIYNHNIQPNAVILECPFGSLLQSTKNRFEILNIPSFPIANMTVFYGGLINGFNAFSFKPEEYAKKINVKTLVLYGKRDIRVKDFEINNIFNNIKGSKKLKIYKDANHNNIMECNPKRWQADVLGFLENEINAIKSQKS